MYGSQTGTAQAVAERIGREAKRYHFETKAQCSKIRKKVQFQKCKKALFAFSKMAKN